MLKEVSGVSLGGSGFVRGFKSWHSSFDNYLRKLEKLERLLASDACLSPEQLRQVKEVAVNYPHHFAADHGPGLQAKFATANTANLLAAVLRTQGIQDELSVRIAEKQKAAGK